MLKRIVFILFGLMFFNPTFSQSNEKKSVGILSFGMNYFPSYYYEKNYIETVINRRPYGYQIGYCFEPFQNRMFFRSGINGNYFRYSSGQHYELDFALELGLEYPLLKEERKWKLNIAFCIFPTGQFHNNLGQHSKLFSLSAGPVILAGRKLGEDWLLFTEINMSPGYYWYNNKQLPYTDNFQLTSYRSFGIGVRYQLKK